MDYAAQPLAQSAYTNKTREDLIEIIEKFRTTLDIHEIRMEGLNHPDPAPEPVGKYAQSAYRCECGSLILNRNRKRHETSARHIRGVVQIRE